MSESGPNPGDEPTRRVPTPSGEGRAASAAREALQAAREKATRRAARKKAKKAKAAVEPTPPAVEPTPGASKPAPAAEEPAAAAEEPVAAAEEPVAAAEEPVAAAEEPVAAAVEPVAEEQSPKAEEPLVAAEEPLATADEVAAATESAAANAKNPPATEPVPAISKKTKVRSKKARKKKVPKDKTPRRKRRGTESQIGVTLRKKRSGPKKTRQEVAVVLKAKRAAAPERYHTPTDWFDALRRSPAYGLAGFLHLLLLVMLSFWTIAVHMRKEAKPVDVRMIPSRNVIPTDQLSDQQDAMAEVERNLEKAMAGADTDSPFAEASGDLSGALTGEATKMLGLSGGKGGGLGRGGSGGDSSGSRAAMHAGLDWLSRHRTRDGAWRPMPKKHRTPESIPQRGGQVGQTGLALVCFLAAGHEPDKPGPYQKLVQEARDWLVKICKDGSFPQPRFNGLSNYYEVAIGLLALAECLQREEDAKVRAAVEKSVKYLTKTRSPPRYGNGWRYRAARGTDTSVVGWVLLGLKSAEHAKVKVEKANYDGIRAWLAVVTDPDTGRTGYTRRSRGDNAAMTSTGLFLRIMLGEKAGSSTNRLAARQAGRVRVRVLRGGLYRNPYEVYYASLALYQCGGRRWRRFNPKIRDALVRAQVRARDCRRGSWTPGSAWVDGRVINTCFAILTLETYYRYIPQHGKGPAEGEKLLEETHAAWEKAGEDQGKLLAVAAAYGRASRLLEKENAEWDLKAEAALGLARVATATSDLTAAKKHLAACFAFVPSGDQPLPEAVALRSRLALLDSLRRLEDAYAAAQKLLQSKEPAPEDEREKAAKELRAAANLAKLRVYRLQLDPEAKARVLQMVDDAEGAIMSLMFSGNRDEGIERALATVRKRRPLPPRMDALERQLLILLIQRAHEGFLEARKTKSFAVYEKAAADRSLVIQLRPYTRASEADLRQLAPALERLDLTQLVALIGLGHSEDALKRLRTWKQSHPRMLLSNEVEAVERGLLLRAKKLKAPERKRLVTLLDLARKRGESLTALESLRLADHYIAMKRTGEAERALRAVLKDPGVGPNVRIKASLGLSRVYRASRRAGDAWKLLEKLPPSAGDRLDVILERCQVMRARGEADKAIEEYVQVLRAIEHESPEEFWNTAEETAEAYLEAREIRSARAFMEGLRIKDRTFGGDPERRERMLKLMRRADNMRAD